jgi:hypothetical protein
LVDHSRAQPLSLLSTMKRPSGVKRARSHTVSACDSNVRNRRLAASMISMPPDGARETATASVHPPGLSDTSPTAG